jgi:hypothetical protein
MKINTIKTTLITVEKIFMNDMTFVRFLWFLMTDTTMTIFKYIIYHNLTFVGSWKYTLLWESSHNFFTGYCLFLLTKSCNLFAESFRYFCKVLFIFAGYFLKRLIYCHDFLIRSLNRLGCQCRFLNLHKNLLNFLYNHLDGSIYIFNDFNLFNYFNRFLNINLFDNLYWNLFDNLFSY